MIILDASALIKLVVREENTDRVRALVSRAISNGDVMAAPEIAFPESLNGLWRHVALLKDVKRKELPDRLAMLDFIWSRMLCLNSTKLAQKALDVGIDNTLSIYDALYVTASLVNNAPLLTFDGSIIKKAAKLGIELL
jgi:predicted nucleic acid-binding protein